jgi:zinc protease
VIILSPQTVIGEYFNDLDAIQKLNVNDVNQTLKQFLTPEHRISGILNLPQKIRKRR